jgi:WD40 repeat protein
VKSAEIVARKMSISPDGRYLVAENLCCAVYYYDIETLQLIRTLGSEGKLSPPGSGYVSSPDNKMLAIGQYTPFADLPIAISLWDVDTGAQIGLVGDGSKVVNAFGYPGGLETMAFSPDGHTLAVAGSDYVTIWNVEANRQKVTMQYVVEIDNHGVDWVSISDVDFSPDGKLLAVVKKGQVFFRDTQEWKRWPIKLDTTKDEQAWKGIYELAFSPNGKKVATVNTNYEVKLWDVETGQLIISLTDPSNEKMEGYEDASFTFSPDGRLLLLASKGNVWIWDVEKGQLLHTIPGYSASFSPDGTLLAVSYFSSIALYGIP